MAAIQAGQIIEDNGVKWRVRDLRNGGGVGIGTIMPFLATQVQPGWLALDTGALVSRATYPDLWAWVQTNAPLITEADWQTQAAAQTSVGYYSSGDGSTTFRLPRMVDFVRGSNGTRLPGTWQADMFKSHTHAVVLADTDSVAGGKVKEGTGNEDTSRLTNATGGEETRPKNITILYCVKAFDASTNQGMIDITALANEVAGLPAAIVSSGPGWAKWADGTMVQRGTASISSTTGTVTFPLNFYSVETFTAIKKATDGRYVTINTPTISNAPVYSFAQAGGTANIDSIYWEAWGRWKA